MYATDTDGRLSIADLPDDKQATIAIWHNAQRFRAIFDRVDESIVLLKPNGHQIEMNSPTVKFLAIGAQAATDLPFWSAPGWSFASAVQQQRSDRRSRSPTVSTLAPTSPTHGCPRKWTAELFTVGKTGSGDSPVERLRQQNRRCRSISS